MKLKSPSCRADLLDPAYDAKFTSVLELRWTSWGKRSMVR